MGYQISVIKYRGLATPRSSGRAGEQRSGCKTQALEVKEAKEAEEIKERRRKNRSEDRPLQKEEKNGKG